MANISASCSLSSFNQRPCTPSQQQVNSSSTSSIRLLAGSHISSTNTATMSTTSLAISNATSLSVMGLNGNVTNQSIASPTNYSFFQANPHLLNSAVLHSSYQHNSQPPSQYTTPSTTPQQHTFGINTNNIVFKEPLSVGNSQFGTDKKTNTRIHCEANNTNKDIGFQVIYYILTSINKLIYLYLKIFLFNLV